MAEITVTVDDAALQAALRRAKERLTHTRPLMAGISNLLLEALEDNFQQERDPDTGSPWPELALSTRQQRAKQGKWPGQILQVSGQLAASVTNDYDDTTATVSTGKEYAAIHHFGGMAGRGRRVRIQQGHFWGLGRKTRRRLWRWLSLTSTKDLHPTLSGFRMQVL